MTMKADDEWWRVAEVVRKANQFKQASTIVGDDWWRIAEVVRNVNQDLRELLNESAVGL